MKHGGALPRGVYRVASGYNASYRGEVVWFAEVGDAVAWRAAREAEGGVPQRGRPRKSASTQKSENSENTDRP